jgi:hypothetical protein
VFRGRAVRPVLDNHRVEHQVPNPIRDLKIIPNFISQMKLGITPYGAKHLDVNCFRGRNRSSDLESET